MTSAAQTFLHNNSTIELSVVLPVYNKQNSIPIVLQAVEEVIQHTLKLNSYEIVFVDDASTDKSLEVLRAIKNSSVVVLQHEINGGQLKAVETGMQAAKGNAIAFYSCDMQNSFKTIAPLYQAIQSGHDLAIGSRTWRSDTGMSVVLSKVFYRLLSVVDSRMPQGGFDFGILNRDVRNALLQTDFTNKFAQLVLLDLAKNVWILPASRIDDINDKSSWSLSEKIKYAYKAFIHRKK